MTGSTHRNKAAPVPLQTGVHSQSVAALLTWRGFTWFRGCLKSKLEEKTLFLLKMPDFFLFLMERKQSEGTLFFLLHTTTISHLTAQSVSMENPKKTHFAMNPLAIGVCISILCLTNDWTVDFSRLYLNCCPNSAGKSSTFFNYNRNELKCCLSFSITKKTRGESYKYGRCKRQETTFMESHSSQHLNLGFVFSPT